ncbi:MAG: hypothetical protein VW707_03310, partial [Candidatus Puniceispirillum sp.]
HIDLPNALCLGSRLASNLFLPVADTLLRPEPLDTSLLVSIYRFNRRDTAGIIITIAVRPFCVAKDVKPRLARPTYYDISRC